GAPASGRSAGRRRSRTRQARRPTSSPRATTSLTTPADLAGLPPRRGNAVTTSGARTSTTVFAPSRALAPHSWPGSTPRSPGRSSWDVRGGTSGSVTGSSRCSVAATASRSGCSRSQGDPESRTPTPDTEAVGVAEQSHKREMMDAVRGDFERLRARRDGNRERAEPRPSPPEQVVLTRAQPAPAPEQSGEEAEAPVAPEPEPRRSRLWVRRRRG